MSQTDLMQIDSPRQEAPQPSSSSKDAPQIDIALDIPIVKVMHECIVKGFKANKKFIEKQISGVHCKIGEIKKGNLSREEICQQMTALGA
jgi:hypothetical protein